MSKKVMKLFSVLVMAIMVVTTLSPLVFASQAVTDSGTGTSSGSDVLNPRLFEGKQGIDDVESTTTTVMTTAVRVVQIVGVAVAVIMLVVLGIKYVSASPSEKADIKKSLMIYVVGAILIFLAAGILEFIIDIAGKTGINQ